MNFGLNLKLARTAAGMTQLELAEKLGITQAMLSRYERGEQTPSVALAAQMAEALGVDMNTLTRKEERQMKIRKNYNIAPDDAPENFRYLVEEFSGQDESIQTTKFLTLEDANDWAWDAWNHLTPHEQKRDRVSVVYVEKTTKYYLQEDLDDEDWSWVNYSSADTPEGAFDSDEL